MQADNLGRFLHIEMKKRSISKDFFTLMCKNSAEQCVSDPSQYSLFLSGEILLIIISVSELSYISGRELWIHLSIVSSLFRRWVSLVCCHRQLLSAVETIYAHGNELLGSMLVSNHNKGTRTIVVNKKSMYHNSILRCMYVCICTYVVLIRTLHLWLGN